jgi:hypothetical protein
MVVLVIIAPAMAACAPNAATHFAQAPSEANTPTEPTPVDWQVIREPEWGYEIALPGDWMVVLATMDEAALEDLARRFPETQATWIQSVVAVIDSHGPTLRWIAVPPGPNDAHVEWELRPNVLDEQTTLDEWVEQLRTEAALVEPNGVAVDEIHSRTHAVRIVAQDGLAIQIYLQRGDDVWELSTLAGGTPPDDATIQAILDSYHPIGP